MPHYVENFDLYAGIRSSFFQAEFQCQLAGSALGVQQIEHAGCEKIDGLLDMFQEGLCAPRYRAKSDLTRQGIFCAR
jgi:hypothetical protein